MRAALLVLGILLLPAEPRAQEEAPPIFLEKRIFAETSEGKRSFYEVHAVEEGESLWRILARSPSFDPSGYASLLRDFRKANPGVRDASRLLPGQEILVPTRPPKAADPRIAAGIAQPYRVERGDALIRILARRGVGRTEMATHLEAVRTLNPSVRDVDLIYAGRTILLPGAAFFAGPAAPVRGEAAAALTRDALPAAEGGGMAAARPEARLGRLGPPGGLPGGGTAAPAADNAPAGRRFPAPEAEGAGAAPRTKPPYRGLLSDLVRGLGEGWTDRGILYLPVEGGGEVALDLAEYPVVRFSTGVHAVIDFRGDLPGEVRDLVARTWPNYRVVPMPAGAGAAEAIDTLLAASGYHAVKDGRSRPLVIGEGVSVAVPARWVVLKDEEALRRGEVVLVKEVPEKPGPALSAVLRFAVRVGIRILPVAHDPGVREGFVAAIDEPAGGEDPPERRLPRAGIEALDFSLGFLGIRTIGGETLTVGGKDDAYRLTLRPDRMFEAGGARYVADDGTMAPAVRALVADAGLRIFEVGPGEPGRSVFRRVLAAAGIAAEDRRDALLAGGAEEGFEIRASGLFIVAPEWLSARGLKAAAVVPARVHGSTRALMRDFGVEIAGR